MTALDRLRQEWEPRFIAFLDGHPDPDPGHGVVHLRRVVATALQLAKEEGARLEVVLPAAWLHDCVNVPKDSPDRSRASRLAAEHAVRFLQGAGYAAEFLDGIAHAIEAHSYSAGIPPRTVEAKVVQDADRLDALGAIGTARAIAVGAALGRPLYAPEDPFCERREPDDRGASVDHFFTKLLKLAGTMQTDAGRREAMRRTEFMRAFLGQLRREIGP
ncbi:MAG TPA: HD domain-containing protein [Steroidobacteraceae bacterium]|nr:HD domain-containing protein [Steroidobacteraceae bacterium]